MQMTQGTFDSLATLGKDHIEDVLSGRFRPLLKLSEQEFKNLPDKDKLTNSFGCTKFLKASRETIGHFLKDALGVIAQHHRVDLDAGTANDITYSLQTALKYNNLCIWALYNKEMVGSELLTFGLISQAKELHLPVRLDQNTIIYLIMLESRTYLESVFKKT